MLIDKTKGIWCAEETSYLDDVAYQLNVNEYTIKFPDDIFQIKMFPQITFIEYFYLSVNQNNYNYYTIVYEKAKNIIRREKIEKIKNGINLQRL